MLLYFTSTSTKKLLTDVVIDTDNNDFESLSPSEIKNVFYVKYFFSNKTIYEAHDDETVARESIRKNLTKLGFEEASDLANNVKFINEDN